MQLPTLKVICMGQLKNSYPDAGTLMQEITIRKQA
jgi:hypothetical protein